MSKTKRIRRETPDDRHSSRSWSALLWASLLTTEVEWYAIFDVWVSNALARFLLRKEGP
jgi:hypothetical protein